MILSLVGYSDAGKTTALVHWAHYLRNLGYRLGLVKHSHHPASVSSSPAQKDSDRLRRCWPEWVVFAGANGIQVEGRALRPETGQDWISYVEGLAPSVDLVLVEGGSNAPFCKIEVWRGGAPRVPRSLLLARIGEDWDLEDPRGWTRALWENLLLPRKAVVPELFARRQPLAWQPRPWHQEIEWLAHDELLGYDPDTRLVAGYRALYWQGQAFAYGEERERLESAVRLTPGLRNWLSRLAVESSGQEFSSPLPSRGLPGCWSQAVRDGYWRLVDDIGLCRSPLERLLRQCARQYALDERDPREELRRKRQALPPRFQEWLDQA